METLKQTLEDLFELESNEIKDEADRIWIDLWWLHYDNIEGIHPEPPPHLWEPYKWEE